MGKLRPAGMLAGLTGNALVAFALFNLLQQGSCGGYGLPECSGDTVAYVIALPVGITLAIVATFIGGGVVAFTGLFCAVGLGSMAAGAFGDSDEIRSFAWIFGAAFTFFGLLPLIVLAATRRSMERKAATVQRLMATGAHGTGTVTAVQDTGITVNDDPRVELTMRIDPDDGTPSFEATKTITVPRVAIPRTGDRHPVWWDRADPSTWAYGVAEPGVTFNAPVVAPTTAPSAADELLKLNELRMAGVLTDEEFARAKARVLSDP